jgi:hypothetical protein
MTGWIRGGRCRRRGNGIDIDIDIVMMVIIDSPAPLVMVVVVPRLVPATGPGTTECEKVVGALRVAE